VNWIGIWRYWDNWKVILTKIWDQLKGYLCFPAVSVWQLTYKVYRRLFPSPRPALNVPHGQHDLSWAREIFSSTGFLNPLFHCTVGCLRGLTDHLRVFRPLWLCFCVWACLSANYRNIWAIGCDCQVRWRISRLGCRMLTTYNRSAAVSTMPLQKSTIRAFLRTLMQWDSLKSAKISGRVSIGDRIRVV